ncbi:MAG: aminotransferase class V-fold PLP-dependent enzyme [Alphaproteobacteria bacterium]|nr:aminotransferase class V-fold PLP-dependent enzyme [Alphaproteobacteria bacterium]
MLQRSIDKDTALAGPVYGSVLRPQWHLDPKALTVNHGSFGATPRVVLEAQDEWRRRLEEQPTRFMRRVLPDALRQAAGRLAAFLGADGQDLAFVENATVGCNAVLRSLRLSPSDEILVLSHGYAAVRNAARFVAERSGAKVVEAVTPFPQPSADAIVDGLKRALNPRTRIAVIDHITSPSALVLPIERMIAACHAAGARVLIDGAHGPGQVDLDLGRLGADWYAGNCHKWLMAPKGCGFLWARPDRQDGLHPVTISHGYAKGFLAEFDWTGTRDPSNFLAVEAALDFHASLGGPALRARNAALAGAAAQMLASRLGTEIGATGALHAAMALVRLPVGDPATAERAQELRGRLLDEFDCDAPIHPLADGIWLRLSAQAYNDMADFERLGDVLTRLVHSNT